MLGSVSIDDSIELLKQTAAADEAVASEDVDGEENISRHMFGGNKELFEHVKNKQETNLHRY